MKETLTTIINSLVEFPEQVSINEASAEKSVVFEVKVADTDMGKIMLSKTNDCFDVVGNLRFNKWNNQTTLQFMITDIKRS